jgi:S-formylglutathione hydrolase FrmB
MTRRVVAYAAAALALGATAGAPRATEAQEPEYCYSAGAERLPIPASERIVTESVAGHPITVLLPADYATSRRRYPVLYLYHGAAGNETSWLAQTDLLSFTEDLTGERAAIVVMPSGDTFTGIQVDWRNGVHRWESWLLEDVVGHIERTYRVIAGREHRALAGLSAGGHFALLMAAQRPDLFVAFGSFSGHPQLLAYRPPIGPPAITAAERVYNLCGGGTLEDEGALGRAPNELWVRALTPWDVMPAMRSAGLLYLAWGDGVPCNQRDVEVLATRGQPLYAVEPWVADQNERFIPVLRAAGIDHVADDYGCGVHTYDYYERDLKVFWPLMLNAFGTQPPPTFDYRNAESHFEVFGWSFTADPLRAPEFLDVRRAGRRGLTLIGSGTTTVTTAPLFNPHEPIRLSDGRRLRAGRDGRLSFTLGLGPPNAFQQYTPQAMLSGQRFTRRTVRFHRTAARP